MSLLTDLRETYAKALAESPGIQDALRLLAAELHTAAKDMQPQLSIPLSVLFPKAQDNTIYWALVDALAAEGVTAKLVEAKLEGRWVYTEILVSGWGPN